MTYRITPTPEQGLVALICLGIHLSYFFLIKTFVPFFGKSRRNLSWVLTIVSATVFSFSGLYVLIMHARTTLSRPIPYEQYSHTPGVGFYRYDIPYTPPSFEKLSATEVLGRLDTVALDQSLLQLNTPAQDQAALVEARIAFYKEYDCARAAMPWYRRAIFFDTRFQPAHSREGQYIVIFFTVYLVMDLLCGVRYYKEKISLLAGWVHHLVYIVIAYCAVVVIDEAHSFAACLLIEVPTVIIGLGFLDKRLRNDNLFGASYLVFRILFDFALMHEYIYGRPSMTPSTKMMGIYKSLLHVKFFYDWINQQIRLRRSAALAAGKESVQPSILDVKEESSSESSAAHLSDIDKQGHEFEEPKTVLKRRPTVKKPKSDQNGVTYTNRVVTTLNVQESTTAPRLRVVNVSAS
ncbi:hypothetical protein EMPS_03815 [Entomortierella parvispora]|uniref:TLC domain-containing protein n=1 Tax=Entomortierella parvispora TaxID=205924 RepID=A0A9P3H7J9_9FUNG|nr:hypothetical protein EMPS_03815 [Entomortierella parvispora]